MIWYGMNPSRRFYDEKLKVGMWGMMEIWQRWPIENDKDSEDEDSLGITNSWGTDDEEYSK